jgi:hypothetical protein
MTPNMLKWRSCYSSDAYTDPDKDAYISVVPYDTDVSVLLDVVLATNYLGRVRTHGAVLGFLAPQEIPPPWCVALKASALHPHLLDILLAK